MSAVVAADTAALFTTGAVVAVASTIGRQYCPERLRWRFAAAISAGMALLLVSVIVLRFPAVFAAGDAFLVAGWAWVARRDRRRHLRALAARAAADEERHRSQDWHRHTRGD